MATKSHIDRFCSNNEPDGLRTIEDDFGKHLSHDRRPWGYPQNAMHIYSISVHYTLQYLDMVASSSIDGFGAVCLQILEHFLQELHDWAKMSPLQTVCFIGTIRASIGETQGNIMGSDADADIWTAILSSAMENDNDGIERLVYRVAQESEEQFINNATKMRQDELREVMLVLQSLIDKGNAYARSLERVLKGIVRKSGVIPRYLFVRGVRRVGSNPVGGGGFADVWMGEVAGRRVALKVLRTFGNPELAQSIHLDFCKEAMIWRQLSHPNILPFYGICEDEFRPRFAIVSPWMPNGNLAEYLKRNNYVDRLRLIVGIACGLHYLHGLKPKVVHGDLRAANIMIDKHGSPRLADFGLSQIADSQNTRVCTSFSGQGSMRWQAAELLDSSHFAGGVNALTTCTDMYAFGCVCLEVFTNVVPYAHLRDGQVIMEVAIHKRHPPRPLEATALGLGDDLWNLLRTCWAYEAQERPGIKEVLSRLTAQQLDGESDSSSQGDYGNRRNTFKISNFQLVSKKRTIAEVDYTISRNESSPNLSTRAPFKQDSRPLADPKMEFLANDRQTVTTEIPLSTKRAINNDGERKIIGKRIRLDGQTT